MIPYSLSQLWFEIRLLSSILFISWIFYHIHFLNYILKIILQNHLELKFQVPVSIDEVRFTLNGVVEVRGIQLYIPHELHNQWKNHIIAKIGYVLIKFNTAKMIKGFILSGGLLLNIDKVSVMSLIVNVEGRQIPKVDIVKKGEKPTTTYVNLRLIGCNKKRIRERQLTQKQVRIAKKVIKVNLKHDSVVNLDYRNDLLEADMDYDHSRESSRDDMDGKNNMESTETTVRSFFLIITLIHCFLLHHLHIPRLDSIKKRNSFGFSSLIGRAKNAITEEAENHKGSSLAFFKAAKSVMKKAAK